MTRIFIVEDHPVMRRGYASLIESEMDLTICGETGSAAEARQRIPEVEPDLVILDLSLEEGGGLTLISDLHAADSELPILVVSMHDEKIFAQRALESGASGYLMKSEADSKVIDAIRKVLDKGIYLSPQLASSFLLKYVRGGRQQQSLLESLSARQLEVFTLMGQGYGRSEIAEALNLSPKTIDTHRENLKKKLSIDTNAELRRRATIWVELRDDPSG